MGAENILIAGRAHIRLAIVGTAAPVSEVAAPAAAWRDVGLTTPDSFQIVENPTFASTTSHQSDFPTRRFQTTDEATVEVDLQEFSGPNLCGVFGTSVADALTEVSAGHFQFAPPLVGERGNVACLAEAIDGDKHYRWVVPVCFQNAGVTIKHAKTAETTLPLRLAVLGADGVLPFYLLTDDPSFDPGP